MILSFYLVLLSPPLPFASLTTCRILPCSAWLYTNSATPGLAIRGSLRGSRFFGCANNNLPAATVDHRCCCFELNSCRWRIPQHLPCFVRHSGWFSGNPSGLQAGRALWDKKAEKCCTAHLPRAAKPIVDVSLEINSFPFHRNAQD